MNMWKDVDEELAAVKAERDGYREALEKITQLGPGHGEVPEFMAKKARQALGNK